MAGWSLVRCRPFESQVLAVDPPPASAGPALGADPNPPSRGASSGRSTAIKVVQLATEITSSARASINLGGSGVLVTSRSSC